MTKNNAIALALKVSKRENIDMYIVVEGYADEREWEAAREADVDTYYNGAISYLAASGGKLVL
jgi:hypothetical protein